MLYREQFYFKLYLSCLLCKSSLQCYPIKKGGLSVLKKIDLSEHVFWSGLVTELSLKVRRKILKNVCFPYNLGLCGFQMYFPDGIKQFFALSKWNKSKFILSYGTLVGSSKCVTIFQKYSDMPVSGMNIFSFKLAALVSIVTFYVLRQLCGCSRPTVHSTFQPNFPEAETPTGDLFIVSLSMTAVTGCSVECRWSCFSEWYDKKDIVVGILRLAGNVSMLRNPK
jgi:hypothetical protein